MSNSSLHYFEKNPEGHPKSVADFLSLILLNVKRPDFRKSPVYAIASDEDARIGPRILPIDKAYAIKTRFKEEGYTLFIDEVRVPMRGQFAKMETCIVARTFEHAKEVVRNLGKPKAVYTADFVGPFQCTAEFTLWLDSMHPGVVYHTHKRHEPKPKITTQSVETQ